MEMLGDTPYEGIILKAAKCALAQKSANPLTVGTIVATLNDKMSYELREIRGDEALVGYKDEGSGEVEKVYPLADLFDVNLAKNIALGLKFESLANSAPLN